MGSLQRIDLTIEVPQEPVREVKAVIANIDPASAPTMLLFLAVDVSQETLLQRKLVQTDRLSQLGALVSGVAHELNNPLAAIAAFAELLSTDALDPQLRESATIIHSEAMRGGRIVQTLLDFARQRPRVTQAVDLKNIAERVLALHRSALKKARVRADIIMPTDVPLVMGDPQELQQVLLNAVVNAQQAIESTGQAGRVAISARTTDHHVLLTIDDTGPGVPTDILDRVFDPFFTTKGDQGTGLGLAITHGLVKAMGGRVWIQNIEGGGARVAIELPAGLRPPDEDAQGGFHPAARPLSVLVVEDENSVRRGMVLMAERLGHRVRSAPGYDEALEELALGKPSFDALLVDVHLDDAHSGFDLFDRLKDEGQGLERHVVFTTGDSISSQTRDRLERSQRPILHKPFSLDELRDVL